MTMTTKMSNCGEKRRIGARSRRYGSERVAVVGCEVKWRLTTEYKCSGRFCQSVPGKFRFMLRHRTTGRGGRRCAGSYEVPPDGGWRRAVTEP